MSRLASRVSNLFGKVSLFLANRAGMSLAKARLMEEGQRLEEHRRIARTLLDISSTISSSLNLQEVLNMILEQLEKVVSYDYAVLFLLSGDKLEQVARRDRGHIDLTKQAVSLEEYPLNRLVLEDKQPVLIQDTWKDERWVPRGRAAETRSWIGAPLLFRDQAIGILGIGASEPGLYQEEHVQVVLAFANHAAVAIENARLYHLERERYRIVSTLLEISKAVSSTLGLNAVLETILDQLRQVVDYDTATVMLLEEGVLRVKAGRGFFSEKQRSLSLSLAGHEHLRRPLEEGQPLIIEDVRQWPSWEVIRGDEYIRSWMGVPLISRGKAIGLLNLDKSQPGYYYKEDAEIAAAFASQAAIAIENASLYDQAELERRKLSAILEGTADAVIALDDEGKVILVNPAARRAFGFNPGQILDRPLSQTIPNEPLIALFVQAAREWKVATTEIETPEGRTLHAAVSPVEGVGWAIIMRDITHLKELDRLKSDLIAMVSHDLKNPITTIKGFVELLGVAGKLNEDQRGFVKRIEQAANNMINLIDDLLDIAKIEAGLELHVEPCKMTDLILEVMDAMKSQAIAKSLRVYAQVSTSLPPVKGDKERLKQVIANLLSNAIKYTPPGGKVTVRAECQNGQVVVEVEDTGIGISPQDQEQLFQKFYRVRTAESAGIEGTGLGLAIVKSIVEQHGGKVFVRSELGIGSTFGFLLPCISPS
ncbi:MAG: GAF domain-containing protein [Anaerolineae bacterium]